MSISCLQGKTGTFLFHGRFSRNHIHVSVTAIFLVFLRNYTTFLESPIGQFVCSLVNPSVFFIIHPAPFRSGDLWGYVRKVAWWLSTQSRPALRDLPTHLPLFSVTSRKQLKVEDVVTSREKKYTLKGTIFNAEKALVRVTSS